MIPTEDFLERFQGMPDILKRLKAHLAETLGASDPASVGDLGFVEEPEDEIEHRLSVIENAIQTHVAQLETSLGDRLAKIERALAVEKKDKADDGDGPAPAPRTPARTTDRPRLSFDAALRPDHERRLLVLPRPPYAVVGASKAWHRPRDAADGVPAARVLVSPDADAALARAATGARADVLVNLDGAKLHVARLAPVHGASGDVTHVLAVLVDAACALDDDDDDA